MIFDDVIQNLGAGVVGEIADMARKHLRTVVLRDVTFKVLTLEILKTVSAGLFIRTDAAPSGPVGVHVTCHVNKLVKLLVLKLTEPALQPEAIIEGGVEIPVHLSVLAKVRLEMAEVREILLVAELALDADEGGGEDEVVEEAGLPSGNAMAYLDMLHGREGGVEHFPAHSALEVQVQRAQIN